MPLAARTIVVDVDAEPSERLPPPDPFWAHPDDGRTLTGTQRRRLGGHLRAWRAVVEAGQTMLVVEPGTVVGTEHDLLLSGLLDAGGLATEPVLLCEPPGVAVLIHPGAALVLITSVTAAPWVPVDTLLADAPRLDPALAVGAAPSDGHDVLVDHLRLGAGTGTAGEVLARLGSDATVVGAPAEILAAFAACGAPVVSDGSGSVVIGEAEALIDGVEPIHDEGRLVLPRDAPVVWINGRPTATESGLRPPIVLGPRRPDPDDAGARDLGGILRYDGAVDPASDRPDCLAEVAPDLLLLPFWTPAFCATVIRAAEAMEAWGADEHDPVPGNELSLATISPRLFAHVEDHLAGRVAPALRRWWPLVDFAGLQDAFVIKYTAVGQRDLRLHHDVAQVSAAVRLNDDFDGGLLHFPRQGYDNGQTPVGSMLTWPSLVTHPHRSTEVTGGVKYSLTVWWRVPVSYRSG